MQNVQYLVPGQQPAYNPNAVPVVNADDAPPPYSADDAQEPGAAPVAPAPKGNLPQGQAVRPITPPRRLDPEEKMRLEIQAHEDEQTALALQAQEDARAAAVAKQAAEAEAAATERRTQYSRAAKSTTNIGIALAVVALVSGAFWAIRVMRSRCPLLSFHCYDPYPIEGQHVLAFVVAAITGIGAVFQASRRNTLGLELLESRYRGHVANLQAQYDHLTFYQVYPRSYDDCLSRLNAVYTRNQALVQGMINVGDQETRWRRLDAALAVYTTDADQIVNANARHAKRA
jgi:hypothetical protein